MTKEQLIKLLEDSKEMIDEYQFLIVGSQSINGHQQYHSFNKKNKYLQLSEEADVICLNHDYNSSECLESIFGEDSYYHKQHKSYLQIVETKTICLLKDYEYRLNKETVFNRHTGKEFVIFSLSPEDLFLTKMIANREKDFLYCKEMIDFNLIDQNKCYNLFNKNKQHLLNQYPTLINEEKLSIIEEKIKKLFSIDKLIDLELKQQFGRNNKLNDGLRNK